MIALIKKIEGLAFVKKTSTASLRNKLSKYIVSFIVYILLIEFAFVFLFPFIFMIINSLKYDVDLRNMNRQWVLTAVNLSNYVEAISVLKYWVSLKNNLIVVLFSTFGHVFSCAFIAYGLARFNFWGKKLIFTLVILSILVPPQLLIMPLYIQFSKAKLIGTFLPIIIPSYFGFGLKGGLFIFIYNQFFKGLPASYEESAKLEGCGPVAIFFKIMFPIARTSMLVVSSLSVIWHWNDYFEPNAYLSGSNMLLSQMLDHMPQYLYSSQSATGQAINPVQLAACFLVILPLLLMFLIIQRRFMAGVEFSGLAN